MRDTVNNCFKAFVNYIDNESLSILVDVLVRDNEEFVQDMEDRELDETI